MNKWLILILLLLASSAWGQMPIYGNLPSCCVSRPGELCSTDGSPCPGKDYGTEWCEFSPRYGKYVYSLQVECNLLKTYGVKRIRELAAGETCFAPRDVFTRADGLNVDRECYSEAPDGDSIGIMKVDRVDISYKIWSNN